MSDKNLKTLEQGRIGFALRGYVIDPRGVLASGAHSGCGGVLLVIRVHDEDHVQCLSGTPCREPNGGIWRNAGLGWEKILFSIDSVMVISSSLITIR